MSAPRSLASVRPEQGPPLSIPITFFLSGPVALCAAGALLLSRPDDGVTSALAPSNVALVHLCAVGMLLLTMLGALYQLLPVVAGAEVPAARLAHLAHGLLAAGGAALVLAQAGGQFLLFVTASVLLLLGLALFLLPAGWAIGRSPMSDPTTWGLRLGLAALLVLGLLGLRLASIRIGVGFDGNPDTLRWAHAHVGFVCLVGGLVSAVSWQVLPMFFLAASPPRAVSWGVTGGVALSLLALPGVILAGLPASAIRLAALPGALAVWLVQPAWALWALRGRKRRRKDATLYAWWLAMGAAPLCLLLGAWASASSDPRAPLLYGLAVLWGWAGALVHGMLARIVPFLVWLHWCAPRVTTHRMRSAKELLTDREVAAGFVLHLLSLSVGAAALGSGSTALLRLFGATLFAAGGAIAWEITTALRRGRTPLGVRVAAG